MLVTCALLSSTRASVVVVSRGCGEVRECVCDMYNRLRAASELVSHLVLCSTVIACMAYLLASIVTVVEKVQTRSGSVACAGCSCHLVYSLS